MMTVLGMLSAALYGIATVFLAIQGLHSLWLLVRFLRSRGCRSRAGALGRIPDVLVQLPVFNERDVVERIVDAAGRLDWPREHLRIQLLDDGTDDSVEIGAGAIARLESAGLDAEHVRRTDRRGYKAGALAAGLERDARHSRGGAPFIAIFDADFVPEADFLRRALPVLLDDEKVAFVQGRWEHLNASRSLLTRAQAIGTDGHFAIEQGARAWSGLALNFNGTCGVWRRRTIEESGGWQHDTLTEDLDLSYRAQLAGWKAQYLDDLVVPGELPPTLEAWRSQQHRWAKGSIETARKLLPGVWRSSWSFTRKAAATLHLTHYLVHPAILASLLLAPLAVQYAGRVSSSPLFAFLVLPLFLSGLLPPLLLYVAGQVRLGRPVRTLLALPALMSYGTGIAWSNTRAVWQALGGQASPFVRTPKYGSGQGSYRARPASGAAELGIATLGAIGLRIIWSSTERWFAPLLLLYVVGFALQGGQLLVMRAREAGNADRRPCGAVPRLLLLGSMAVTAATVLATSGTTWRDAPWLFSGAGLVLGICCFLAMQVASARRATLSSLVVIIAVGAVLHCVATALPMSDDVNRYAVEGRQFVGGQNPYAVPPAGAAARAVVVDDIVSGVNHPEMTAIYPPLMLLVHAGVAALGLGLQGYRWLALFAIAMTTLISLLLLLAKGRPPTLVVAILWNPVSVLFVAGAAHHDVVAAAALVSALLAIHFGRARLAVLLATTAVLLKPLAGAGLLLILLATSWRHVWIPLLVGLLCYLPFAAAGHGLVASLLAFGGTMKFHGVLEPVVRTLLAPYFTGEHLTVLVRLALVAAFVSGTVWLARRSRGEDLDSRVARGTALLLLCLPTLHPWYFTPLVALLPFTPSRALLAWTAAAPFYFLHGVVMPEEAPWAEWPWAGALAHAPFAMWMLTESFGPWRVSHAELDRPLLMPGRA